MIKYLLLFEVMCSWKEGEMGWQLKSEEVCIIILSVGSKSRHPQLKIWLSFAVLAFAFVMDMIVIPMF